MINKVAFLKKHSSDIFNICKPGHWNLGIGNGIGIGIGTDTEVFNKKGVFKNFAKLTGNHL